jgi:Asp-tRNA(Asn)/Glu-tRNA(Gln) amidotransferase A subunit family amidase
MNMFRSGFFDMSIEDILNGYQQGTLSPLDIAETCIRQTERCEPNTLAWVHFDPDHLRGQAGATAQRIECGLPLRQLEGVPVGIKDIINTCNFPTEMGSPIWKDFTPGNDARVVFYLRQAGAMIPGKTVTAEFAVHTPGKTLNPHDPSRTPGTSSSGSAAAIATGMLPAALGTQTAGSIVRPASFCGIYGCKPSFGLIPRTGLLKTTDSLDTVGFFTLHSCDLERVFNVIHVHGKDYPLSNAALNDRKRQSIPEGRPWNIALVKTHVWEKTYPYAQKSLLDWAARLSDSSTIQVNEARLPEEMSRAHEIHATIYNKTLSYYFKEEFQNATLVSPIMKDLIMQGNHIPVKEYQKALIDQQRLAHAMDDFLKGYDIMISLSTAGEAPPREEAESPDPALMWTMTHLPVISAPVFVSPGGLPFGVQIVARRYNDPLLFRFCRQLRSLDLIPAGPNPISPSVKWHSGGSG